MIRNGGTLPPAPAGTVAVPGRIVSSGRLERYKGHQRAIAALPHVMREVPDAHVQSCSEVAHMKLNSTNSPNVSVFPIE